MLNKLRTSVENFQERFSNLPSILTRLHQLIGDPLSDYRIKNTIVESDATTALMVDTFLPAITMESLGDKSQITFAKINDHAYVYTNVALPGLNQHPSNPNLYLTLAPELIERSKADLLYGIVPDQTRDALVAALALRQLKYTVNLVSERHPGKDVSFLILGEETITTGNSYSADRQNTSTYKTFFRDVHPSNRLLSTTSYYLPRENLGTTITPYCYYLNASGHQVVLNSASFEDLYTIYQRTIGADNPIIIHDSASLVSAPKIALAFEIFRNFDVIFESTDAMKIAKQLEKTFNLMRRAFADDLLSSVTDVDQAIYLAFSLKVVEFEHLCHAEMARHLASKREQGNVEILNESQTPDKHYIEKFKSAGERIDALLEGLAEQKTYEQRSNLLNSHLIDDPKNTLIRDHQNKILLGHPTHFDLLSLLHTIYGQRVKVEQTVIPFCSDNPAAEAKERTTEESRHIVHTGGAQASEHKFGSVSSDGSSPRPQVPAAPLPESVNDPLPLSAAPQPSSDATASSPVKSGATPTRIIPYTAPEPSFVSNIKSFFSNLGRKGPEPSSNLVFTQPPVSQPSENQETVAVEHKSPTSPDSASRPAPESQQSGDTKQDKEDKPSTPTKPKVTSLIGDLLRSAAEEKKSNSAPQVPPPPAEEKKPNPAPQVTPPPAEEKKPNPAPQVTPPPAEEKKPNPAPQVTPPPAEEKKPNPAPQVTPPPAEEKKPNPAPQVTLPPAADSSPEVSDDDAGFDLPKADAPEPFAARSHSNGSPQPASTDVAPHSTVFRPAPAAANPGNTSPRNVQGQAPETQAEEPLVQVQL